MYQWHKTQWEQLIQRKGLLPHAILLHGRSGIGKGVFAESFASALLCQQADGVEQACGHCQSCLWLKEGAHPDFKLIAPEDDATGSSANAKRKTAKKRQISVVQIRQLADYLSLSTHQVEGYRVILISPAETLNNASANALLKMLEEPPANTLFILVTSQPQRLLPTIISRCQAIDLPLPAESEALAWLAEQGLSTNQAKQALAYAGGAPLTAWLAQEENEVNRQHVQQLSLGEKLDPAATASLFLSSGMEPAIDALQKWVFDLMNVKLMGKVHYHVQSHSAFLKLSQSVNMAALMTLQQDLLTMKRSATHPLSNEMQLHNIFLQYTRIFKV